MSPEGTIRRAFAPSAAPRRAAVSLLLALLVACSGAKQQCEAPRPPVAAVRPHAVPSPNGARNDPYYWLRDDTRSDPDVLAYLAAENAYAEKVMAPLQRLQDALYAEIVARIVPDDASPPRFEHGYWYYQRMEAGREYAVVARRKGTMAANEEVLIDGNALARGEGFFALGGYAVSPDGTRLAYADDHVGRRQYTLHVRNLSTGETLPDAVANVQPDIAWLGDDRSVLYVECDPVTLLGKTVKVHVAGTPAAADRTVYSERDDSFYLQVIRSRFDRYVYIHAESTESSEWLYADGRTANPEFRTVLPREPKHLYEVEDLGEDFVIRTNWQAPNFRIVTVPAAQSADKSRWRDVVPARPDVLLEGNEAFEGALAVNERLAGVLRLRIVSLHGGPDALIESAEPSYANALAESHDPERRTVRYVHTTLGAPDATYEYDIASGTSRLLKQEKVPGFDPARYTTDLLMAPARDGRSIPVSLVRRKDTPADGTAPLYLNGYGAYGWSTDPVFHAAALSLLDRGFVVGIAHVRGGQERGRAWYEEGRLLNKRNTFTDFIDATDFLVARKIAAPDKVFAYGGSAGGMLMGAIANLAPEKYRGIVADVPFVDVVTTMLDTSIPLTTNEFDEWGDPRDPAYYRYMLSYSPYDNVRATAYPAMFVTTGLWDSQVQYYEPTKWVAKLRAAKTDSRPLVLRVNMEAGHGGQSGRYRREREIAAQYAFVLGQLGVRE